MESIGSTKKVGDDKMVTKKRKAYLTQQILLTDIVIRNANYLRQKLVKNNYNPYAVNITTARKITSGLKSVRNKLSELSIRAN